MIAYLRRQDTDVFARRQDLLSGVATNFMALTVIAQGLAIIFLPLWFCGLLSAVDVAAKMTALRAMRRLTPENNLKSQAITPPCGMVAEVGHFVLAAVIWQIDILRAALADHLPQRA